MEHGRGKFRKLEGGGAVASAGMPEPFMDDPHQQGLNLADAIASEGRNRSVYLSLFRRHPSAFQASSPLYKVQVADSDDDDSFLALEGRETLHRMCNLETDMAGKTFVTLQSGWIVGIGGNPGRTIIFDTKGGKVIRGPDLLARKLNPVVAVVGDRIYALASAPDYLRHPNFVPWFEVLDLSNPVVTKGADGLLCLDSCYWKALPYPVLFPHMLTPMDFRDPPYITVRSYVVVGHYILVSVNQPSNCVFGFDTNSGEWHKIVGEYLPFVGAATPHGHGSDDIFLAFSQELGPIKAYRIHASTSSRPSDRDGVIQLSITAITIRDKEQFEVGVGGSCRCISLDREHFSVLFWYEGRGRYLVYDTKTDETYPRKLYLKLVTYRTESPVLQGKTPEILISSQREQTFKVCSSLGFSGAPIAFVLSI
jgi:hypothetical protein